MTPSRTVGIGLFAVLGGSLLGFAVAEHRAGRGKGDPPRVQVWDVLSVAEISAEGGLVRRGPVEERLSLGATIRPGDTVASDAATRARLAFADGSHLLLDRGSEISFAKDRTVALQKGVLKVEVTGTETEPRLRLQGADVGLSDGSYLLSVSEERAHVEVLRGEASVDHAIRRIHSGEEGVLRKGSWEVVPSRPTSRRLQLSSAQKDTARVGGLGELRAKRPGSKDEKGEVVRLQEHEVRVRIAGAMAKTEVEEIFTNDTDAELEGIYRFPLPPGASIERLALDVDGKLVEGSFVDRDRAQAIWRGVIHNAAPKAPKPVEQIIWVPGPWRDPALLEWQRAGRAELRIFPIPKRGSRRVVLAYTEEVPVRAGVREYVYPLPEGGPSSIGHFRADVRVAGAEREPTVHGYDLVREGDSMRFSKPAFVPTGDLRVEYTLPNAKSEVSAWSYADQGDSYAVFALRPTLPRAVTARARDHVLVLDTSRSMVGERFTRSKELLLEVVRQMDRRDRILVLSCDVRCEALGQGFREPGGAAVHDLEAALARVSPEGALDLVGAVRAAARRFEGGREKRVHVFSAGAGVIGYRSPKRVAEEVREALGSEASALAIPIGTDANVDLLSEVASGGGGTVVAYHPGMPLESSAEEVLLASYGQTLRDASLTLPPGLTQVAPSTPRPIRAGEEVFVAARWDGRPLSGEFVLRGHTPGGLFEARYAPTLELNSRPENAFVPRLFAKLRIQDREREPGSEGKAELVSLSERFHVPSRHTSLLVLESEAMFQAFGIARDAQAPRWTADAVATGHDANELDAEKKKSGDEMEGLGLRRERGAGALGEAAPKSAPSAAQESSRGAAIDRDPYSPSKRDSLDDVKPAPPPTRRAPPRGPLCMPGDPFCAPPRPTCWTPMKRVYFRTARVVAEPPALSSDALRLAEEGISLFPNERQRYVDLSRALLASGQGEKLLPLAERWSERDPLDPEAVHLRADSVSRKGERALSLRIRTGTLAALSLKPEELATQGAELARGYERLGQADAACALRVASAEARPLPRSVAYAVRCERALGHEASATRWLRTGGPSVDRELSLLATSEGAPFGEMVLDATWEGEDDLDLEVVDPTSVRHAWAGRSSAVRASDCTHAGREVLALSKAPAGTFTVGLVRTGRGEGTVRGYVRIQSFGEVQRVPFVLSGTHARVARVEIAVSSRLEPAGPQVCD